jgi:hypothetical protein
MNLYNHEKKPKKLPKVLTELGEMKFVILRYHGAVDIRLARSVRQLCCVLEGL